MNNETYKEEKMENKTRQQQKQDNQANRLINEAIKRILLDIVIRGHGDRLIGRWSREPEIQHFLEQVPYMLDRINQLHLACTRADSQLSSGEELLSDHHHHHHHYHHHHSETLKLGQTSLNDFVNLIGSDRHWLVRSRDPLGLTPLHKAVLFNNRPIAEYILDRYQDELAPMTHSACIKQASVSSKRVSKQSSFKSSASINNPSSLNTRLIDAQDKYGRTALHYAAFSVNESKQAAARDKTINYLYHFLVSKGASMRIVDFRGKTAPHYARHPNQLRLKSIIHLSNKLNANYQANVLSKTLRATSGKIPAQPQYNFTIDNNENIMNLSAMRAESYTNQTPDKNRESLSVSCKDLSKISNYHDFETGGELEEKERMLSESRKRSQSTLVDNRDVDLDYVGQLCGESGLFSNGEVLNTGCDNELADAATQEQAQVNISERQEAAKKQNINEYNQLTAETFSNPSISSLNSSNSCLIDKQQLITTEKRTISLAQKQLIADRCPRLIINQQTKFIIRRSLNEGVVDKINDLLAEGYGSYIVAEAGVCCWNQHCKRYISNVIPNLLTKVDTLHELIADNQVLAVKTLLNNEPILARIKRPYRRAAMSALHVAVQLDRRSIVKYLIEHFSELIGQQDSCGATCLHWAAKSLKLDKLYCWLLERFAHQLENVRDFKGKLASDYRQQAFRLSSSFHQVSEPSAVVNKTFRRRRTSVENILHKTQQDSNKLQLMGKRIEMKSKKRAHQTANEESGNLRSSSRVSKVSQGATICSPVSEMFERSVEIGIDSPSSQSQQQPECFNQDDNSHLSSDSRRLSFEPQIRASSLSRRVSDVSCGSNSSSHSDLMFAGDEGNRNRRSSVSIGRLSINEANALAGLPKLAQEEVENSDQREEYLMNEMVQLDSEDLNKEILVERDQPKRNNFVARQNVVVDDDYEDDSPLATPPISVSSRPTSASSSSKHLDVLILECIISSDIRKLEHLILAGCGQRILNTYEAKLDEKEISLEGLSEQMKNFLTCHTAEEMKRISSIHDILHKCYAVARDPQLDLNATFHKLCNLLSKKRLIMARDCFGASPLHVALMRSDRRLVDYLLRRHPEAASAPDQESRNAAHYAALTLAAYNHHGPFRLTRLLVGENSLQTNKHLISGYWQIDETIRVIYENLCLRYGDLISIKDKRGFNSTDYLAQEKPTEQAVTNHSGVNLTSERLNVVIAPSLVFGECCAEYANLLTRYNYVLVSGDNEDEPTTGQNGTLQTGADEEPSDEANKYQEEPAPVEQIDDAQEDGSNNQQESNNTVEDAVDQEPVEVKRSRAATATRSRQTTQSSTSGYKSRTDEDLVAHLDQPELLAPIGGMPFQATYAVKQVAPKPIVGSQFGFPLIPQFSGSTSLSNRDDNLAQQQQQVANVEASSTNRHHHNHQRRRSLLDDLNPNLPVHKSTNNHKSHRKYHKHTSHHHYHHHHHHHHKRAPSKSNSIHQSIVGGVIVPTIIHNDKMDEIETYDIIYRQPQSSTTNGANQSNTSSSSFSSSGSQTCSSDDEQGNAEVAAINSSQQANLEELNRKQRRENKELAESVVLQAKLNSESSDSELEDEDDRVERLSNEFESRVRREKSELRAKVDQIMNEIKISAKSGKSSRFLASPSELVNLAKKPDSQAAGSNGNTNVLFVDSATKEHQTRTPVVENNKTGPSLSLSSSGNSSARTSCSSASSLTSNLSQTLSCSSSIQSTRATNTTSRTSSSYSSSTSTLSKSSASSPGQLLATSKTKIGLKEKQVAEAPGSQHETKSSTSSAAATINTTQSSLFDVTGQLVSKNTYGQTYLHFIASRSQSSSTLYKVLDHGRHLIGERDIFYRTARDVAVQFNLSNNVQVLDKFIIDLFIGGNTILLRHLLNQGYSPLIHVSDADGNDIMLILKLLKLDKTINFLLQMADFQRWRDELHTFIRNGYSAGVSELIKKHKDLVKAKSVHSRSSLHLAVLFDRVSMIKELLETDPSCVNLTDNMGRTALHYTYGLNLKNVEEIRDQLLSFGASLDARDVKMRTPKYYYIFKREIEEIKRIELELN